MARVAKCPQCEHEMLIPDGADAEAWAKCPECRAFFQMSQASTRELASALLVEPSESTPTDDEIPGLEDLSTEASWNESEDDQLVSSPADELGLEDDELKLEDEQEPTTSSGEELEAAAQRIDEWFRSAKTLPDVPPAPTEPAELAPIDSADLDETPVDDFSPDTDDFAPSAPSTGATLDFSADDMENVEISNQYFEFDDIEKQKSSSGSPWEDTQHMDLMLGDEEDEPLPHAEAGDPTVTHFFEESVDDRPEFDSTTTSDEVPDVTPVKTKPPKKRSALRSIFLATAAAIIGLAAGYIALLWIAGPSGDFLQVAELLPKAILPSSFDARQPIVIAQNRPQTPVPATPAPESPVPAAEAAEEAAPETTPAEVATPEATVADSTATESPEVVATEEQPAATEPETVETVAATETESEETPAEVQADYTEETATEDPAANEAETEAIAATEPSTEEMAEELETPPTEEPSAEETALEESTVGDRYAVNSPLSAETPAEPAELAEEPAAELVSETEELTIAPVRIEDAPTFTSTDVSAALDLAKNAQPNLIKGNFTDSQAVARAKGLSYAALADLAQKATFEADAQPGTSPMQQETDALFRETLADPRIRSEVAVILPKWVASKNRKHGGVFFAGSVADQQQQGTVTECRVELNGGQSITVLTPSTATGSQLDTAHPQAIVGYIIDQPAQKIEGYTGSAKQAIWTSHLVPLE